jgi:hypothetical protein
VSDPLRIPDEPCSRCERTPKLVAHVNGKVYCGPCWRAVGCPFPTAAENEAAQVAAMEAATVAKMVKRGGADRHRAKAGKV